jgi:hypothetical protein
MACSRRPVLSAFLSLADRWDRTNPRITSWCWGSTHSWWWSHASKGALAASFLCLAHCRALVSPSSNEFGYCRYSRSESLTGQPWAVFPHLRLNLLRRQAPLSLQVLQFLCILFRRIKEWFLILTLILNWSLPRYSWNSIWQWVSQKCLLAQTWIFQNLYSPVRTLDRSSTNLWLSVRTFTSWEIQSPVAPRLQSNPFCIQQSSRPHLFLLLDQQFLL